MFIRVLAVIVLVTALAPEAVAQQWSAEQEEVLDHLVECWDIGMGGFKSGSHERWIAECSTPEQTYWLSNWGAPSYNEHENIRRNFDSDRKQILGWVDIRPVSLTVVDDIAVLHFYGAWRIAIPDGEKVEQTRRTEVFRRIDGRWKLMAGHATPVSSD